MTPGAADVAADVVIVGAGPTGLISSLLLADRGHPVVLIEKWPAPYPLPRAVGINHETLRALQSAGVIDDLLPQLLFTADGSRRREIRAADGEVLAVTEDRATSASGWPERASFCQPELEKTLNGRVVDHPLITVFRGWTATRVEADADGVLIVADPLDALTGAPRPLETGEPGRVRAAGRYLLGCDGANSIVRQSACGELVDLGFAFDWLVVDVIPNEPRTFDPHLGQILGPPRPITLVSGGPGRRRWEFMRLDGETMAELNSTETAWRLLEPFDVTPQNATLERHAVYTFGGRWARSWHSGRAVLAGDAAHLMPPFLGEGFNSGVRDALAVSWQLDLVLRGHAPVELLDAYSSERLGHVRQIIDQAVAVGRTICVTDPQEAKQRDEQLRELRDRQPAGPFAGRWRLGPGNWRPDDPVAGHLGVQGRVGTGGRVGRFDDLLGHGRFVLLSRVEDPTVQLPAAVRAAWARIGGVTVHFGDGSRVTDVDGTYAAWFAHTGAEVAVLRPDFYVYGTGSTVDAAGALLAGLLGSLGVTV